MKAFEDCKKLLGGLKQDELDSKGKPTDYAGRDSCKQRFNLIIKTYLEGIFDDSDFLR